MDTPTLHGLELSPGDEVGTDAQPNCCDQSMTPKPLAGDDRKFKCGGCSTVVVINSQGLVFDIR